MSKKLPISGELIFRGVVVSFRARNNGMISFPTLYGKSHSLSSSSGTMIFTENISHLLPFREGLIAYAMESKLATLRYLNYPEDIKGILAKWERALQNKTCLMGDKLTYVDFVLYEHLDWHLLLSNTLLDTFPALKAYVRRFRNLPRLADYFASERYQEWAILSPSATKFRWNRSEQWRAQGGGKGVMKIFDRNAV